MAEYGIPYMGSKSGIANEIVSLFPPAENFYDLFGGGFSVTHAMLLRRSKDYKHFHFNEIRPSICDMIKKAIAGEYNYDKFKPPFVSREEFSERKEIDAYIKTVWSFGNNGRDYMFGKDIEQYKQIMHNAVVFNEFDDTAKSVLGIEEFDDKYDIKARRMFVRYRARNRARTRQEVELQQLQQLERLQQLQQLERLERLQFYNTSYEQVPIRDNSIIYCDPPYHGTAKYDEEFDHKKFLNWAAEQKSPVFISEYNISDKRFMPIFKINKRSLLSKYKNKCVDKVEKVYVNMAGLERIRK